MRKKILPIDKQSVEYWDNCLYEHEGIFNTNHTSDVVEESSSVLRKYAEDAFKKRRITVFNEDEYIELNSINLLYKKVLDFGCGAGIDSLYMAQRGAIVTICDIVPANIFLASKILEPYNFSSILLETYNDIDKLGMFDVIYSHGCIHHIQPQVVSDVISLLKSHLNLNGIFLVLVYTNLFYPSENAHIEGPYTRGYSIEQLRQLFGSDMTLEHFRIFTRGHFMWALFRKSLTKILSLEVQS